MIRWQPEVSLGPTMLGALLVLVAAVLTGACAFAGRAAPAEDSLRVLVYNIHAGKDAAGEDNLERVAGIVRETGAGLVLLQEVDRGTRRSGGVDQLALLSRLTGYHGAFGKTLDYQGGEYGIAILSRWPILRDTLIRLPVQPAQERAGGSYEPRGALHAVVAAPGGPLHLLNTHLDASAGDEYRLQEAGALAARAAVLRDGGASVLIGGDLNATPESETLRVLTGAGWRDAWAGCGAGEGMTYPAAAPVKRIDYLLLPPGLGCDSAAVVVSEASDHRGILFVLSHTK